jgi:hypothetical protein
MILIAECELLGLILAGMVMIEQGFPEPGSDVDIGLSALLIVLLLIVLLLLIHHGVLHVKHMLWLLRRTQAKRTSERSISLSKLSPAPRQSVSITSAPSNTASEVQELTSQSLQEQQSSTNS